MQEAHWSAGVPMVANFVCCDWIMGCLELLQISEYFNWLGEATFPLQCEWASSNVWNPKLNAEERETPLLPQPARRTLPSFPSLAVLALRPLAEAEFHHWPF